MYVRRTAICSVVDLDPQGAALTLVGWIQIRIQVGKRAHKTEKKVKKCSIFLKVLDVLC
jgi:hypothetical protein